MPTEIRKSRCTCGVMLWDRHTSHETFPGMPIALKDVPEEDRADIARWQLLAKLGAPLARAQLRHQRRRGS